MAIVDNYTKRITLDDLKSFLWGAATLLRGQIDAAGYKEFIFPLLFFKRISDVFDEQYAGFLCEGGEEYANAQTADLPIRIPKGAHWEDVRKVTENVGQALVQAFIAIETSNRGEEADGRVIGGLTGIFGPKDGWTNKAKMPDHIITSLIEHFSKYTLNLETCPADEMGQAYEYLVGKFADDAGNTAQEFYTNRTVVTLMAEILQPKPDESIYDPTCGSGGMLVKCLDYLRLKGQPWRGVKVFGQEVNALTASIARMNLYLNGVEDFSIVREDTLAHPAFVEGSQLRKFDIVLANPPYSIKEWNRTAFENDKWGRNMWGTPPQARADYAFIQHIAASLNDNIGRAAILLPHGVLNRNDENEVRSGHIKSDIIEAIIGLGRNLFYNSGLESFIFIFNKNKKPSRKNRILFIEAENFTHKDGKQAYLNESDINTIVSAFRSDEDIAGLSKHVDIKDILVDNDANLNIKLYVKREQSDSLLTTTDAIRNLEQASNSFKAEICGLLKYDETKSFDTIRFGTGIITTSTSTKRVKLSDVAFEVSTRIDNPSKSDYDFFIGSDCIGRFDFRIHKRSDASIITSSQKGFSKGDYLLVRRSLYGSDFRERAPRADFDGVCSADILTIREKPGVIADGFLIYVLYQSELWDFIVSNSNGGLTRRIKWKQLADFEFDLPPYDVQKSISKQLWSAYNLKESNKRLLEATREMVKSQFIEMFKDCKNKVDLSTVCNTFIDGDWIESKDQSEKGIRLLQTGNVGDAIFKGKDDKCRYISEDTFTKLNCTEVITGDILVSRLPDPVGRSCIVPQGLGKCITAVDCSIIRLNEKMNSKFFIAYTQSPDYMMQIKKNLSGSTRLRISRTKLGKIQVPLPPLALQEQFAAIYEQADKSEFELKKSIDAIDAVIKSLINN